MGGYDGIPKLITYEPRHKGACPTYDWDKSTCTKKPPKVPKVDCEGEWQNVCKCYDYWTFSPNWSQKERDLYSKKEKWVITKPAEGTGSTTTCQRPAAEAGKVIVDWFMYTLKPGKVTPPTTVYTNDDAYTGTYD